MSNSAEDRIRTALERVLGNASNGGIPPRVVHEMALCRAARVDIAAISERLVGWEIKTRSDTLARLPRQQAVYSRVFDYVWLVLDDRHIQEAMMMVPGWWGVARVLCRNEEISIVDHRRAKPNPTVDLKSLVQLLWRDEVLEELSSIQLSEGMQRAPRRELWEALAAAVPQRLSGGELKRRVRQRLRVRACWRADERRT